MPLLPRFRNVVGIMLFLTAAWLGSFIFHEHLRPANSARRCSWARIADQQTNVLLVGDPQLIDNHTYPSRNMLQLSVSKHITDVYLKQNYKALVNHLEPDYIMFLGDYFDNGRSSSDRYFEGEFRRFERIFNRWPQYRKGDRWITNVAGNHDIGFGDGVKLPMRDRFVSHFGPVNKIVDIKGVEVIVLDTVSYSSSNEEINSESHKFVQSLSLKTQPRILLSHVPFYRDTEKLTCGPMREVSQFWQHEGYQYKSALSEDISAELLNLVQPDLIFSGDHHDYCDVIHPDSAHEITIKSMSMAMGIKYPAVQMLSFVGSGAKLNYKTNICYLPMPLLNVIFYGGLAIASAFFLLFYSIKSRRYVYTILPSEHVTAMLLGDDQTPMSKRMSKFLQEEDSMASLAPLSNYTKTNMTRREKWEQQFRMWKAENIFLLRRWNFFTFLRLCGVLMSTIIFLYAISISFV